MPLRSRKRRETTSANKTAGETPYEDLPGEAVCCHPETSDDLQSPHSFVELKTDVSTQKKNWRGFGRKMLGKQKSVWLSMNPITPIFQFNEYLWLKFKIFLLGKRNNCMRRAEPKNLSELIVRLVALGSTPNFNVSNQSVCSLMLENAPDKLTLISCTQDEEGVLAPNSSSYTLSVYCPTLFSASQPLVLGVYARLTMIPCFFFWEGALGLAKAQFQNTDDWGQATA